MRVIERVVLCIALYALLMCACVELDGFNRWWGLGKDGLPLVLTERGKRINIVIDPVTRALMKGPLGDRAIRVRMAACLGAMGLLSWRLWVLRPRRGDKGGTSVGAPIQAHKSMLSHTLLKWTEHDHFRVSDLLNGGVLVLGGSGSGKTSGSLRTLGMAIIGDPNSAGLILAAKPGEDRRMWVEIFEKAGRSEDLLIFDMDGPLKCDFLDYIAKHDKHSRNIVQCLMMIGETLSSGGGGKDQDQFWERQKERALEHAVTIVRLATGAVRAGDLLRFIQEHAQSAQQLREPDWQKSFHNQLIRQTYERDLTPADKHDRDEAERYWLGEIPNLADKTRSSILVGVTQALSTLNLGMVKQKVASETNVSPDDILAGKWVLVDTPVSEFSAVGLAIQAGWKYILSRRVLQRVATENDPYVVTIADEFQQVANEFDSTYISASRSHKGCLLAATQTINSLYQKIDKGSSEHMTKSLLSNFQHKIIHSTNTGEDAEYASSLLGNKLTTFTGGSLAPVESVFDEIMSGASRTTASFSTQLSPTLEPAVFLRGLLVGGPANNFKVTGVVIKSGTPFHDGNNHLFVTFSQR